VGLDANIYKTYKTMRNSVRYTTRKLEKEEQKEVAMHCRKKPKIFWKYISSKRQIRDHISDLKTQDKTHFTPTTPTRQNCFVGSGWRRWCGHNS